MIFDNNSQEQLEIDFLNAVQQLVTKKEVRLNLVEKVENDIATLHFEKSGVPFTRETNEFSNEVDCLVKYN